MYKKSLLESINAYFFIAPAISLLGVWVVYPLVQTFYFSFHRIDLFRFETMKFVGFKNYMELFRNPEFLVSLRTSLIFVFLVVPFQSALALVIAVLLEGIRRGKSFFRTAFFTPYVTPAVAAAIVFMRLFTKGGLGAKVVSFLGFPNTTWYNNLDLALLFLALVYVWMTLGFYILLFLTGLQTIPEELRDAARVDGASGFQVFVYVTLPSLKPFILLVLLTAMISAFQVFDQAYVLARGASLGSPAGATMTLPVFVYAQAFRYNRLNYGATASVILLIMVLFVSFLMWRSFREERLD